MTPEEKQLLIKDLCARLPYGVKIKFLPDDRLDGIVLPYLHNGLTVLQKGAIGYRAHIKNIRPYLRPLSSMTEEEVKEFAALESIDVLGGDTKITCVELSIDAIDWLNAHHFDYRGLLEKGLALEAPEGMYKTE